MPTIIKVHEVEDTHPVYINADLVQRAFTSKASGRLFIQFVDGSVMSAKESPDEIAALIHEAMNPDKVELRYGVQTGNWPGLTEFHGESTSDGR